MAELKRCPFCGGEVVLQALYGGNYVECGTCKYSTRRFFNMEDAIKAWNNRTSPWHTGTPTEEGLYLIAIPFLTDGIGKKIYRYETDYFNKAGKWRMFTNEVVAYQKITPYEGEVTNG